MVSVNIVHDQTGCLSMLSVDIVHGHTESLSVDSVDIVRSHTGCLSMNSGYTVVFPPAPKKGMVRLLKKGTF